jgi:hypothetical protein
MGQRIILSEEEKLTIQKMYGLINEQGSPLDGVMDVVDDVVDSTPHRHNPSNCVEGNCVNGKGKQEFENGLVFEGQFRETQFAGGTFTLPDGDIIKSNNRCVKPERISELKPEGLDDYGACIKGDCKSGEGIAALTNGLIYQGEFNTDEKYHSDTDVIGHPKGKGKLTLPDGSVMEGVFDGWKLVNKKDSKESTMPQNWIDGINKKGWLIQKGTHGYEGKIPNTKDAIKIIQKIVGASSNGIFGAETEKKVKEWQTNNGLKPDGKVGKNTLSKML